MSSHIFLQGPRNIGKSTVIRKTLDILKTRASPALGGFFTWSGGPDDPTVRLRPAESGREREIYRVAVRNPQTGGLVCDSDVFEQTGARLLKDLDGVNLIIMDELGFLENNAPAFKLAVFDALSGDIPALGVMRLGDIPWLRDIKNSPMITLLDVNENNRDVLPGELATELTYRIGRGGFS